MINDNDDPKYEKLMKTLISLLIIPNKNMNIENFSHVVLTAENYGKK